jgi:sulfhydrogenase subunit beta (sulfur reductase)
MPKFFWNNLTHRVQKGGKMAKIFNINKEDMQRGIDKAVADYKVAALTQREDKALYDFVKSGADVEFTCKPTILSPKKFFFPQDEVIVEYTSDGKVAAKIDAVPIVLFGIRPCDLNAIKILDEAFAESNGDPNYLAKREQAIIIGADCKSRCDEDAFCHQVDARNAKENTCDAMMYMLDGSNFAVEVKTAKGEEFFNKYFTLSVGDTETIEEFKKAKADAVKDKPQFKNLKDLPEIFHKNKHHKVWEEEGEKCLSCGSCIMGCPTCYCFDVADELELNLDKGQRIRRWDACMLSPFAMVAGDENFRESQVNRLRHRIDRKFNYLMKKHGQSVCVGCGRCVRACLANINPKTIVEKITESE